MIQVIVRLRSGVTLPGWTYEELNRESDRTQLLRLFADSKGEHLHFWIPWHSIDHIQPYTRE